MNENHCTDQSSNQSWGQFAPNQRSAALALIEIGIKDHPDYILLIRRSIRQGDPWSGHFAFPGGRQDPQDQHPLACCLRELREECGIHLTEKDVIQVLDVDVAGRAVGTQILVHPFLFCIEKLPDMQLQREEIAAVQLLNIQEFKQKELHESRAVLAELSPPNPTLFQGFPIEKVHTASEPPLPANFPKEHLNSEAGFVWGLTYRLLCKLYLDDINI